VLTSSSSIDASPPHRNVKCRVESTTRPLLPAPLISSSSYSSVTRKPSSARTKLPSESPSEIEVLKEVKNIVDSPRKESPKVMPPKPATDNDADIPEVTSIPVSMEKTDGTNDGSTDVSTTFTTVAAVTNASRAYSVPIAAVSNVPLVPLSVPPLYWHCKVLNKSTSAPVSHKITAMIDSGSSVVLIRDSVVNTCGLRTLPLQEPIALDNAFSNNSPSSSPPPPLLLDRCVELRLEDRSGFWTSKSVFAIVSPSLVSDVILGMPFITTNHLLLDPDGPSVIVKGSGFDLLNPSHVPVASIWELKCLEREECRINRDLYCTVIDELNSRVDGSFMLDPVIIEKAAEPSAI
ncbi:hypothetical protein L218DRAFT_998640, partial [Marasmius fiardii PR-910]